MSNPLRIFIGYDPRQAISFTVLQQSLLRRASAPISVTPLVLEALPIKRQGLTPFTYSRFLCPWLCDYEGWSLFLDVDMLCLDDIAKLFAHRSDYFDVMVVKNEKRKFEWSSMMLFDNSQCTKLTPEYIEAGRPLSMDWARNIGNLPSRWNHLVGYDEPRTDAGIVHFTQGVPAWPETAGCEYASEWKRELASCLHVEPWANLMGQSVHAERVLKKQPVYSGC